MFDTPAEREAETKAMRDVIGRMALMLIALSPSPDVARTRLTDWLFKEAAAADRVARAGTGEAAERARARTHVLEELRGLIDHQMDKGLDP